MVKRCAIDGVCHYTLYVYWYTVIKAHTFRSSIKVIRKSGMFHSVGLSVPQCVCVPRACICGDVGEALKSSSFYLLFLFWWRRRCCCYCCCCLYQFANSRPTPQCCSAENGNFRLISLCHNVRRWHVRMEWQFQFNFSTSFCRRRIQIDFITREKK